MKRPLVLLACAAVLLTACSRRDGADPYAAEAVEREAFVRSALDAGGASRALGVASTWDIQFEEGFSILSYELDSKDGHADFKNHAFRWMGQHAHVRLKSHGARPMRLIVAGWMHHKVVGTRPVINLFIDGIHLGSTNPIREDGHYWFEKVVPEWMIQRPWVDLVIQTTAVGFHWSDPPELRVLNVYKFAWTEER